MRITADTNVLLRALMEDDETQSPIAQTRLAEAELVALTLPTLCELVWVLARGYKVSRMEIAATIRTLIIADNVAADRPAVDAGLALLDAGGDFADGVIAHSGRWLGAETFASFDKDAVEFLEIQGEPAVLLG